MTYVDPVWPSGSGEMAACIRAHGWTATPLGPIEAWPLSLRTTVNLTLGSPVATILLWGPAHIQIYNDHWRVLMGDKHPAALGQPTHECFPEIADTMASLYERAQRGDAVILQDMLLPIGRRGAVKDAWWNVHYLPVRDDGGRVAGIFCTVIETTTGVLAERERTATAAALRESEARLRAIVTAGSYAVYRMSPDWRQMHHLDGRSFLADTDSPSEGWVDTYILPEDRPAVFAAIETAIRDKGMFELEHRVRRADGGIGWTLSRAVPILTDDGAIAEWLGAASDVTTRKAAEAVLRASEERQAFLLKFSDTLRPLADAVAIQGEAARLLGERLGAGRVLYTEQDGDTVVIHRDWVRGVPSMAGRYPAEAWGGELVTAYRRGAAYVTDDVATDPRIADTARTAFRAAQIAAFVGVGLVKEGQLVATFGAHSATPRAWTSEEVELVRETAERTWASVKRARAEAEMRKSEERHLGLYNALDQGFCTIKLAFDAQDTPTDYQFVEVSPSFEAQTGIKDAAGRWMREIAPDQDQLWFEAYGGVALTGEPARFEASSGPLGRWWSVYAYRIGDPAARTIAVVFSDITERKRIDAALRDSEERFAQFAASSSDALWIRDAGTLAMEYTSPAIEPIYGIAPDGILGDMGRWVGLIVPECRDTAIAHITQAQAGAAVTHEFRIRRPSDGEERWIRNTDFPLYDAGGRVQRVGGIAKDVTEGKAIEAALVTAEVRQRALIEGVPHLVWRAGDGGAWTWASPQWCSYTGQSEADSHGYGWQEPVHPGDRDAAMTRWQQAEASGAFVVEYRLRNASDDRYRWFQTRAVPVRDAGGAIVEWLGTSTDVDDLRAMQERQSVMVAELQHRTRNLLGVVRSISGQTMRASTTLPDFEAAFNERLAALSRVQGLLSRSDEEPITIGALIQTELDALGAAGRGERIRLAGPEVGLRKATVQTFALALHELATNARKYGALTTEHGRLSVTWRTYAADGDGPRLHVEWQETGLDRRGEGEKAGGYGRELIERALPYVLKARTTYELGSVSLRCTIDLPLTAVAVGG